MVPASGNLAVAGKQFWLGPARAGVTVTFWADCDVIHLLIAGARVKTVCSHLSVNDLATLAAAGGHDRHDRTRPLSACLPTQHPRSQPRGPLNQQTVSQVGPELAQISAQLVWTIDGVEGLAEGRRGEDWRR